MNLFPETNMINAWIHQLDHCTKIWRKKGKTKVGLLH